MNKYNSVIVGANPRGSTTAKETVATELKTSTPVTGLLKENGRAIGEVNESSEKYRRLGLGLIMLFHWKSVRAWITSTKQGCTDNHERNSGDRDCTNSWKREGIQF